MTEDRLDSLATISIELEIAKSLILMKPQIRLETKKLEKFIFCDLREKKTNLTEKYQKLDTKDIPPFLVVFLWRGGGRQNLPAHRRLKSS